MVEQDQSRLASLREGSSRSFRLEQLGARLLRARNDHSFRVLALSAVAARAAPALARWIAGTSDAAATTSSYRSTRQMLGRIEVSNTGQYTIRYNLMDGRSLRFEDHGQADTPFVASPFPPLPGGIDRDQGPEVQMRAPTLWAALQLAAQRPDGSKPSVLISLTQGVEAFSVTCADLMEEWSADTLPNYWSPEQTNDLWVRCLACAADYFTVESVEYRLLSRGIAVHHGKMPGLLARRLKAVIDRGFVRVIIATSTLSEGVNIPVHYVLIPSVCRGSTHLSLQEFTNLIGRAGRPGVSTEGSALVVLPERAYRIRYGRRQPIFSRQWDAYEELVASIERTTSASGGGTPEDRASSPLAHLLSALEDAWVALTGGGEHEEFLAWLEQTAVVGTDEEAGTAYDYLDSLDAFLIAAIQEVEELRDAPLTADQIETELIAIWRRTYAFAAARDEARLAGIWLARGRAIKDRYPDAAQRRRIYKTSLPPRSATSLLERAGAVRTALQHGIGYAFWPSEQRFTFIRDILNLLSEVPSFRIATTLGRKKSFQDWPTLLRWWLAKTTLPHQPAPRDITNWYDFVSHNFIYRGAWGLGSIIGLLLDADENGQPIRALEIGDWPRSGLPWIAFWIKELVTWGTLEPVAAFLLARGDAVDRPQAEQDARAYYDALPEDIAANDALDPRTVADWLNARRPSPKAPRAARRLVLRVRLVRSADDYQQPRLSVSPLESENELIWIDPAGYTVALTNKPTNWPREPSALEFELHVPEERIIGTSYLRHK